jgi:outer membrane lipoprotein-sorting protein
VSYFRRASTRSLLFIVAGVLVVAAGAAAIAVAAGGGGPTPPPEPLDQAIHDALAAAQPDGVTARVDFTNNLFPSGALLGQTGSALMSGASGRLWITNDGHGRIELQSDAGDVQIVWDPSTITVYDASSNTVYKCDVPQSSGTTGTTDQGTTPTLDEIDNALTQIGLHWALSDAQPTDVAGQAAYSVSASPQHDGGLLGSVQLAWDAEYGMPLSAGIYAQGNAAPVLALTVTDVSYGAVASSDVDIAPPSTANVVDLGSGSSTSSSGSSTPVVTGLDAVQAAAGFPVVAPDTLVGLPLRDVRLIGGDTAVALYGEGLGGIAVVERKADTSGSGSGGSGAMSSLPTVSLDGLTAHELSTQLGTVLEWQSGGTSFVLAGSQPAAAAEAAARAVK